eukprot:scaffold165413_cov30-Tisochrysis_lutea.AAC.3
MRTSDGWTPTASSSGAALFRALAVPCTSGLGFTALLGRTTAEPSTSVGNSVSSWLLEEPRARTCLFRSRFLKSEPPAGAGGASSAAVAGAGSIARIPSRLFSKNSYSLGARCFTGSNGIT